MFFLLLLLFAGGTAGSRILAYFPFGAKSHHNVFQPILLELAERGHLVTYYTPFPLPKQHANVTTVVVDNQLERLLTTSGKEVLKRQSPMSQTKLMGSVGTEMTKMLLSSQNIQDLLSTKDTYDLVFHEAFFLQEHAVIFLHKFNAIGVSIMPLGECAWVNELSGLPDNPSYMIDFKMIATDRLSFTQKLEATWTWLTTTILSYYYVYEAQKIIDQHAKYPGWETRPPLFKLLSDQALILTNSHHSAGYAYPKAPHLKEIGGINVFPPKSLPPELQQFMDDAKDGVIYFSLGSVLKTSMFSSSFRDPFSDVFGTLKQRVIWKYDGEPWPGMPRNIKIGKWFPQQSLLAHKNMKLFITHGGLLSTFESISNGIPLIVIPFFGDQYKNARRASSAGFGVELHNDNITDGSVAWAVSEILQNPSYRKEAVRRKAIFHDRPLKPLDEAVYWIEYVLRHGRVLQPASASLSFVQLHLLDVWAFIVAVLFILTYWLPKLCIRKLLTTSTNQKRAGITKKKQ